LTLLTQNSEDDSASARQRVAHFAKLPEFRRETCILATSVFRPVPSDPQLCSLSKVLPQAHNFQFGVALHRKIFPVTLQSPVETNQTKTTCLKQKSIPEL
jgi:hypothetical protein